MADIRALLTIFVGLAFAFIIGYFWGYDDGDRRGHSRGFERARKLYGQKEETGD